MAGAKWPITMNANIRGLGLSPVIIGIDLGTTNSLAAIWRNGEATLIPNALGHVLTPSVVSIGDNDEVLVGLPARERLSTHPMRTASVFKRYMGTNRVFTLGKRDFRPEELSSLVLRALKTDAETYLGEPVDEAVITVPAYFNDLQRKATQTAGALAGLKVRRLLTEPTAAALAYGIGDDKQEKLLLVIDLGGGTFDVSLLHCFEGIMEVRATAGDTWLGGEDFVDALANAFMSEVGGPPACRHLRQRSRSTARCAIRPSWRNAGLSDAEAAEIALAYNGSDLRWPIDRAKFERLTEPVLARVRLPIERALARRARRSRYARASDPRRRRQPHADVPPPDRAAVQAHAVDDDQSRRGRRARRRGLLPACWGAASICKK